MPSGQVIRIVNEGESDFKDMYGNQPYIIPAHGQMFVDFDAMCLWLGHPESNDFDPRNRVRLAEYQRLRIRYGVDARALEDRLKGISVDTDEMFQKLRPHLVAYEASSDIQIITVADDPDGTTLIPVSDASDNQGLIMARMAQMESEMAGLRSQLAQQNRTEQALNDAQPIATDTNPDLADMSSPVHVGQTASIPGTVITSEPEPDQAPRPPSRTTTSEDAPTRVRVSG